MGFVKILIVFGVIGVACVVIWQKMDKLMAKQTSIEHTVSKYMTRDEVDANMNFLISKKLPELAGMINTNMGNLPAIPTPDQIMKFVSDQVDKHNAPVREKLESLETSLTKTIPALKQQITEVQHSLIELSNSWALAFEAIQQGDQEAHDVNYEGDEDEIADENLIDMSLSHHPPPPPPITKRAPMMRKPQVEEVPESPPLPPPPPPQSSATPPPPPPPASSQQQPRRAFAPPQPPLMLTPTLPTSPSPTQSFNTTPAEEKQKNTEVGQQQQQQQQRKTPNTAATFETITNFSPSSSPQGVTSNGPSPHRSSTTGSMSISFKRLGPSLLT